MESLSQIIDTGITNSKLSLYIDSYNKEYENTSSYIDMDQSLDFEQKEIKKNTYYILHSIRISSLKNQSFSYIIVDRDNYIRLNDSTINGKCDMFLLKILLEEDGFTCEINTDGVIIITACLQRKISEEALDRTKK